MSTAPKEEQPEAVRKVVEAAKGSTRQTPAMVLGTATTRRTPNRPLAEHMERGLDQLETTVDLLAQLSSRRLRRCSRPRWWSHADHPWWCIDHGRRSSNAQIFPLVANRHSVYKQR
jgi:hypothetical protein